GGEEHAADHRHPPLHQIALAAHEPVEDEGLAAGAQAHSTLGPVRHHDAEAGHAVIGPHDFHELAADEVELAGGHVDGCRRAHGQYPLPLELVDAVALGYGVVAEDVLVEEGAHRAGGVDRQVAAEMAAALV